MDQTNSTTTIEDVYEVEAQNFGFAVRRNGTFLTDANGSVRIYVTRNAARKRISRERSGNFHS